MMRGGRAYKRWEAIKAKARARRRLWWLPESLLIYRAKNRKKCSCWACTWLRGFPTQQQRRADASFEEDTMEKHSHVAEFGVRCAVYHGEGEPQCLKCRECFQWIRPMAMTADCPGPPEYTRRTDDPTSRATLNQDEIQ